MKVIIVDNDMTSLSCFLASLVNEYAIEYKFFKENPLDTISYLKENRIDGVFLGTELDEISGFELAKRMIHVQNDLKIVFLSSKFSVDNKIYKEEFNENFLGICDKPLLVKQIETYIKLMESQETKKITIKTFGSFDIFINKRIIKFSSAKAKELLALLITYNGKSLNMFDAICHLWPDKDVELAKRLYRDAVWKLRKTLKENKISFIVEFKRAQLFLFKQNIECDYWDYLLKPSTEYSGMFLPSYDWSIEFQSELDSIKIKREYTLKS